MGPREIPGVAQGGTLTSAELPVALSPSSGFLHGMIANASLGAYIYIYIVYIYTHIRLHVDVRLHIYIYIYTCICGECSRLGRLEGVSLKSTRDASMNSQILSPANPPSR